MNGTDTEMNAVGLRVEPIGILAGQKRASLRRPTYFAQSASYVIDALLLALFHFSGATPSASPIVYLIVGLTWTGCTLALSEAGFNDGFADHYLTVPQCLGSITIQLCAIYFVPEVGLYFACIIFIILSFGSLRMTAGQAGVVWTYACVGLAVLFCCTHEPIALPMETQANRSVALLCFVTAFGRCTFTGLYGATLREALYRRGNELKAAYTRIEELARTDELTGVLNRRSIMEGLEEEIRRSQRLKVPLSVAMVDLDHFKNINDRYGHPAGDEVLKGFAVALSANTRQVDKLGRYGGEEFLLIFPSSTKLESSAALDRLRQIVASIEWIRIAPSLHLTVSCGVIEVCEDESPADVLSRVDDALYQAKNAGRNRVVTR